MITKALSEIHPRSFNPLGLLINPKEIPLRSTTNPYFTLRLAPNPLFRVSSHYPLLHPPTNSFWYRIGTEALTSCHTYLTRLACLGQLKIQLSKKKIILGSSK